MGGKSAQPYGFGGREMLHTELGRSLLSRLKDDLEEIADVEQPPRMETRIMSMILSPKSV